MSTRTTTLRARRAVAVLAATAALGGLAACGAGSVDAEDLQDRVAEELGASQPEPVEAVDCPEDLPAEEGATVTCVVTLADGDYDAEVEVTGVDGNEVGFSIQIVGEAG